MNQIKKSIIESLEEENQKLKYKVKVQQDDIDCLRNEIEELQLALEAIKRKRGIEEVIKER